VRRSGPVLRRLLPPAGLIALALLVHPGHALADALTPESGGSPNADAIDTLYKIILAIAVVILVIVEGSLIWCLRRFKAAKGRTAAQIHGNTNLEIGWTVGAALVLVVLAVVTFAMLGKIDTPEKAGPNGLSAGSPLYVASNSEVPKPPGGKALRICVTGRQYIWRYTYAACDRNALGKVYAYEEMVVPEDTPVILEIESTDVAHSWWIPKLGGKFDAIPGDTSYTWFKAPKANVTYEGQCAELCGRNHADMTARVRVMTATDYQQWFEKRKTDIDDANRLAQQQRRQLEKTDDL